MKLQNNTVSRLGRKHLRKNNPIKSIGVIVKNYNQYTNLSLTDGIKEIAKQNNYKVIISSSFDDHENEKNLLQMFTSQMVQGIIIDPVVDNKYEIEHLYELKTLNCPFVLLDEIEGIKTNYVKVDHRSAAKKIVKYLLDSGHKNIIHFTEPFPVSRSLDWIVGFKDAFSESSVVFNEKMIVKIDSRYPSVFNKTLDYFRSLNRKNYPSAIVCFNDFHALAIMSALKELKLRVPEDISIVGNDEIFYSRGNFVPLAIVKVPMYEIGVAAAKLLIKNIESSEVLVDEQIEFDTELVLNDSSKYFVDQD